jgi:ferredoxin
MALLITGECISCGACLPECPNEAIFENRGASESAGNRLTEGEGSQLAQQNIDSIYVISYDRCTECVGHFDEPQCAAVCPVPDCCVPDPTYPESKDVLLEKAKKLNPDKTIEESKCWSGVRG